MTASLLFQMLLQRCATPVRRMKVRMQQPRPVALPDDGEPERPREQPFWTYFLENPRPNSTTRDNDNH